MRDDTISEGTALPPNIGVEWKVVHAAGDSEF